LVIEKFIKHFNALTKNVFCCGNDLHGMVMQDFEFYALRELKYSGLEGAGFEVDYAAQRCSDRVNYPPLKGQACKSLC